MSRVLIVSDELDVRQMVISMLSTEFWMMLPECVDSGSAMVEINRVRPRLVVIQAELRNRSGLELAAEVLRLYEPGIVIVARNGMMAAKAFDVGVADYVMTPLRQERMTRAIRRGLGRRTRTEEVSLTNAPAAASGNAVSQGSKLRVKSKGGFIFLKHEELVWVEAAGNYLNLHCVDRVYRVREPLTEFNARLNGANFVRIHRSIIVNTVYIRELRSWGMGDYVVVLRSSKELPVSRSYRDSIDQWMANGDLRSSAEAEEKDATESGEYREGSDPGKVLSA